MKISLIIIVFYASTIWAELEDDQYLKLRYQITKVIKRQLKEKKTFYNIDFVNVTFTLHIKDKENILLEDNNLHLLANSEEIILLVHGWHSDSNRNWIRTLTKHLADIDKDVVTVDFQDLAEGSYLKAINNVPKVGSIIAKFLTNLSILHGVKFEDFKLIGYSLGAHVCGLAGRSIPGFPNEKIGQIVGLAPTGPGYEVASGISPGLNQEDAELVIVVHTDSGSAGILGSVGHVDFFLNGGMPNNPSCLDDTSICDNSESHKVFTNAILGKATYLGTRCSDFLTYLTGACDNNHKIKIGTDITAEDAGMYYMLISFTSPA